MCLFVCFSNYFSITRTPYEELSTHMSTPPPITKVAKGGKSCKHSKFCDSGNKQCCACQDTNHGRNDDDEKPFFPKDYASLIEHYCKSCTERLLDRFTTRYEQKISAFKAWKKHPASDMERSTLFVNFLLRSVFPFEVAQMALSFLVLEAPCAFFSTFDGLRRTLPTKDAILKDRSYHRSSYGSMATPSDVGAKCNHDFCKLEIRGYRGCCGCQDKRKFKEFDITYIVGKGDRVVPCAFYKSYCDGCQEFHRSDDALKSTAKCSS